jgi:hypothetical protein
LSSTNRTKAEKKISLDYYVTPLQSIRDFVKAAREDGLLNDTTLSVLDPCAGGDKGALFTDGTQADSAGNPMSYPTVLAEFGFKNIATLDIRLDSLATMKGDYLAMKETCRDKYDIIITNPPFNIALDIIKHALSQVKPRNEQVSIYSVGGQGGLVIMLQRLNFLGSQERSAWFKENMPAYIYVHSKRMRFRNTMSTDSIEYAHYVWLKDYHPQSAKLRVI